MRVKMLSFLVPILVLFVYSDATQRVVNAQLSQCDQFSVGTCGPPVCPAGVKCTAIGMGQYACLDQCGECKGNGQSCNALGDCCSLVCEHDVCVESHAPGGDCTGNACGDGTNGCPGGYKCDGNGGCTFDEQCYPDAANVPYNGPIIKDLTKLFGLIFGIVYPAAELIGVVFIALAGYKYMTSEGNPQKTKDAQEDLTAAVLGTLFVVLSVAILKAIINSMGISSI